MHYPFTYAILKKEIHKIYEVYMKQYIEDLIKKDNEFNDIIHPLIENKTVQEMKNFRQHY